MGPARGLRNKRQRLQRADRVFQGAGESDHAVGDKPQAKLRHVSSVPVPLSQRKTAGWTALGAPSRRPSRGSRGSAGHRRSFGDAPEFRTDFERMADLGEPRTAAERLLRAYLVDRVPDPVALAERVDPSEAAHYATLPAIGAFYGADGSTAMRRPLTATDHAITKRQERAASRAARAGGDGEDDDDGSVATSDAVVFGLTAFESYQMKRNDLTVTARTRINRNRKDDELRAMNGHAIIVHKRMLRKVRRKTELAKSEAEREGRDASAPRPLMALEDRALRISESIEAMEKTYGAATVRDLARRGRAARRIQRFLRGVAVRARVGADFKARCVLDFFRLQMVEPEEEQRSYDPELYDPLAVSIQRCYREYRKAAIRRNWICLKLAARWRAKYKLKKRKQKIAAIIAARKRANELYRRKNTTYMKTVLREWRRRAGDVRNAKQTWKRGMAILVIRNGLKGWYRAKRYKGACAAHVRSVGEAEVQGALVYFLADGDWGRCVEALDKVLRRAADVTDGVMGYCPFLKKCVVGTRLEIADPSLSAYISLPEGDERLLPVAFWHFLVMIDDELKRLGDERRERSADARAEEQKLLLESLVRGLLRDPWDPRVDEGTVVENLPVDVDLWRSPAMSRGSTIEARTHFDRVHGGRGEASETPYSTNGSAARLLKGAEDRGDSSAAKDISLTLTLREGALRFKNRKKVATGRRGVMAVSGEARALGAVVAARDGLFESGVSQNLGQVADARKNRGYKMRWIWDDEICRGCRSIVPDARRARACPSCDRPTHLKADRPNASFEAKLLEFSPSAELERRGKAAVACGVPLLKPTRVAEVRAEKAATFLVHAALLELAGAPGVGWRRQGVSLAKLWKAAVADADAASAELRKRKVTTVGHLAEAANRVRGVHNLLSLRHVKLARRVQSMLDHLDKLLRRRHLDGERDLKIKHAFTQGI